MVRAQVDGCDTLLKDLLVNDSREWRHGLQRTRDAWHTLNEKDGKLRSIGREAWVLNITLQFHTFYRSATVGSCGPDLSGGYVTGKISDERYVFTVPGPSHIAERKVAFHRDRVNRPATCRSYREFSIHDVSDLSSVGRESNLPDLLGVRHGVKYCCGARGFGSSVLGEEGSTDEYGYDGATQH
jgi:hypothetical protein